MSIYGLYSGDDGLSYLAELDIIGNGPALDQPLPCSGWRPFQCEPGIEQDKHPTPVAGLTVVLNGCMEIGVGGGLLKNVKLEKGDMLVVLDTQGEGHSTKITGTDRFQVTGITFSGKDWPQIKQHFSGWPENLLSPE